jgi:hypothetical protein
MDDDEVDVLEFLHNKTGFADLLHKFKAKEERECGTKKTLHLIVRDAVKRDH